MLSVVRALSYRELKTRVAGSRLGWFWIFVEPMSQIIILATIWSFRGSEMMPGISVVMFIYTGFAIFTFIDKINNQCRNAVNSNRALFTYKQVKPFDTMLTRALVEGAVMSFAYVCLLGGIALLGYEVEIINLVAIVTAVFLAWLLAFGLGVFFGTIITVFPEMANIVQWIFRPMLFISGVIFPIQAIPAQYHIYLYWNPYIHLIEMFRSGFFYGYPAVFSDPIVPLIVILASWSLGLILYQRYRFKMVMTA